jgi:hypothetical protein
MTLIPCPLTIWGAIELAMKNDFKRIKQDIELRYLPFEEQEKKAGNIIGNSFFDAKQLDELKRFKTNRDKIWRDIEENFDLKQCFNSAGIINDGFIYLADDRDSIEPLARLYRDAKKKIEKRVDKINKDLAAKKPYFENFPIIIEFKHHLDSPAKTGSPSLNRNMLVKDISKHLSTCISGQADRAKLIERILRFFYVVSKSEADARNIRSYCK